jgi:hypothetical protein
MTHEEWKAFEQTLLDRGYKKWTSAKYGEEDFDISKMVRGEGKDGPEDMYQLIFRFWDFEQFKEGVGYSVDFVVMPCIDGRMDAICSSMGNGLSKNIEFAEKFARDYYWFVQDELKFK